MPSTMPLNLMFCPSIDSYRFSSAPLHFHPGKCFSINAGISSRILSAILIQSSTVPNPSADQSGNGPSMKLGFLAHVSRMILKAGSLSIIRVLRKISLEAWIEVPNEACGDSENSPNLSMWISLCLYAHSIHVASSENEICCFPVGHGFGTTDALISSPVLGSIWTDM